MNIKIMSTLLNELENTPLLLATKGIIRGIGYNYQKDKKTSAINATTHLWIQQNFTDFIKLELNSGNTIQVELGSPICKQCYNKQKLNDGLCSNCYELSEFQKCLFNKPDSFLQRGIECRKDSPACKDLSNAKRCHSNHGLYLGRFGNLIKVGTTRIYRKGSYVTRFLEQGLNEAIIVHGFKSLENVLLEESWFAQACRFPDRLYFTEKVANFIKTPINFKETYLELLTEKYPGKKIEHLRCFEDKNPGMFEILDEPTEFCGKIIYTQGSIIILETKNGRLGFDLKKLFHKEVLVLNNEQREGEFW